VKKSGPFQVVVSPTVGLINLGCVRNTVDSQDILGRLRSKGYALSASEDADVVIVNTCSFIDDAKKESIDTILELAALKKAGKIKKIIVTGCLAERYAKEMAGELPEVDAFVGTMRLRADHRQSDIQLTPPHCAYLKICESCYNACSFCIIPKLKGPFRSRRMEAVLEDVLRMDRDAVREINIVGQDITAYGMDLYHQKKLAVLLQKIARSLKGVEWIRLLYAYPSHVTDELLDVMAQEERVCRYLDIPFQHVSDRILRAMDRKMTKEKTIRLIEKIRHKIPGVSLRTSYIVGFPGETDKEFKELVSFVKQYPMERVGVFAYSTEDGTKAAGFKDQVPIKVRTERKSFLMKVQQEVAFSRQQERVGSVLKVLVEGRRKGAKEIFLGRSEFDAPDVDGAVLMRSTVPIEAGSFVNVRVTEAGAYDLKGDVV
jgi:ribosomal protein S12 methylthiotransferase